MSSNGNVRVKTLDKKDPGLGTSFLLVGALVFVTITLVALWGALVMFVIEYLEKMGLVANSLDYLESVIFGAALLGAVSIISAVWHSAVTS